LDKPGEALPEPTSCRYALADRARYLGFPRVVAIDDDLGVSGAGTHARPGLGRLLTSVCEGSVGAPSGGGSCAGVPDDAPLVANRVAERLGTSAGSCCATPRPGERSADPVAAGRQCTPPFQCYRHDGTWVSLEAAARELGVSNTVVQHLIADDVLAATQVVRYAPWVIVRADLQRPQVQARVQAVHAGRKLPRPLRGHDELPWK
jgi:hypothetical protein